jgi:hypothetical protein
MESSSKARANQWSERQSKLYYSAMSPPAYFTIS